MPDWRAEGEKSARDDIKRIRSELSRHRLWRRHTQVVLVVAVLCAGVLAALAGWRYSLGQHSEAILLSGIAVVAGLAAVAAAISTTALIRRQRELELEVSTERDILALIWSVERRDLWELAVVSRRQMTRFECLAVAQARVSFSASVTAAAAALAVLVGGALVMIGAASFGVSVTTAVLTAAGSALSGFLSVIFLRTYKMTSEQLSYYYGQPLVNCYLLHAERLLELAEPTQTLDERGRSVMMLVDQLLHAADVAQGHVFQLHQPGTCRTGGTGNAQAEDNGASHGEGKAVAQT